MKTLRLLLVATVVLLTGCGADEAIQATKSMPERMDQTNRKMDEMRKKMEDTERALGRVFSFEALLKEEYGRNLIPVPFDLIPFATEFAKYAPAHELVEVVYLWVRKINEITLELPNPSPDDVFKFDWNKMHVQAALQAVAGTIPRAKLEQIVREQVFSSGRYSDAALNLLMLRIRYLRDVMLGASLLAEKMNDVGDLEKAIEYAEEIEYISRLRFARQIHLELTGYKNNDLDVMEVFEPTLALKTWQKIKFKATVGLRVEMKDVSDVPGENERLYQELQTRYNQALSLVNQRIQGWGGRP